MTVDPVEPKPVRDWATLPNAITVLRLLLVVPITVLLVQHAAPVLTLVLLVLFGASDWVDGFLARRLGQTSRTGALLDPFADRVGVAVIASGIVIAGHLPLWVAVVVVGVDLCLGIVWVVKRPAQMPAATGLGKARTAVFMTGLVLIGLGILPGFDVVGAVGQVICGVGAVLHPIVGFGYLRTLLRG
ncbi:CDP-alcohol phosphatidyltransferase family protein [Microbacterium sp. SD291]|uniref:CDP-alcohol phosphatidyltransferase family protein n=1 Tax=Microbacterium sp. SD291 TaxID=2782007 RepID=UPI001A96F852|nr:CDP-alcohol phosphatidyltransferase family protein [Microbacterium sp. SD291]MBO0981142.1 CDP-alcohol phosphatidyltransferase family protein [Microbacterium sp. SD291]